ncbi:hypothetical protein [Streptomyces sp. NPDC052042]
MSELCGSAGDEWGEGGVDASGAGLEELGEGDEFAGSTVQNPA